MVGEDDITLIKKNKYTRAFSRQLLCNYNIRIK